MGANMVRGCMKGGHSCVVFDRDPKAVRENGLRGRNPGASIEEVAALLTPRRPRGSWCRPARPPEETIASLATHLRSGDTSSTAAIPTSKTTFSARAR